MNTTAVQDIEELQRLLSENHFSEVEVDGDIGKITKAAVRSVGENGDHELGRKIQAILFRKFPAILVDGIIGPRSMGFLDQLDELGDLQSAAETPRLEGTRYTTKASSFADLADVRAFRQCKDRGGSDQQCFKVGDNGIGKWGHNTAQDTIPMVALPREVWRHAGKSGGDKVLLAYKGRELLAILGDTMPSIHNIKNGAGIDTNPAVAKEFNLKPPFMVTMTWEWWTRP